MIKGVNEQAIKDTPNDVIQGVYDELRGSLSTNILLNLSFRKTQLDSLRRGFVNKEALLTEALASDLKLNMKDAFFHIQPMVSQLKNALNNLDQWSQPQPRKTPVVQYPGSSFVKAQGRGVVLVIGSWNYPIYTISPLVSAIAAGNAVIIKPSEHAPATSRAVQEICDEYLDTRFYRVVQGAIETGKMLTSLPLDMICFTGSTFVGKIIAAAASKNLVPCVLELGGKCPTIVDHTANLEIACKRIASTKFINCAQTCIAPDYVYVHAKIKDKFIEMMKKTIVEMFGKNPKTCESYSRLVHELHTNRTVGLLEKNRDKVVFGNVDEIDVTARYFPPILVSEPDKDSELMNEEIFGPILPIMAYNRPQEVIEFINSRSRPLAIYYFGEPDSIFSQRLQERTVSGSFVTNDCVMQVANCDLPFGGVGDSGYGTTHGRDGFEQFSHMRSHYLRPNSTFLDNDLRYPQAGGDLRKVIDTVKSAEWIMDIYVDDVFYWIKLIGGIILALLVYSVARRLGLIEVNVRLFPGRS